MDKFDEMIGQALTAEDRALLASHGEPGYLAQAFGIFRGPLAWVMWLVYVSALAAFIAGVWAFVRMWGAGDALDAVKWGVAALFAFQITMMCKSFMGNHMESNRLLREVKRVELQVALLRDGPARGA
jgi:hypothetical protein